MDLSRDLPLRHKLTLLVTLTSGLVVSLACLILAAHDLRRSYQDLETDLVSLARVIGTNSNAALTFDDPQAAREILSAMAVRSQILSACLYDAQGRPFASYRRLGAEADVLPEQPNPDSYHADWKQAVLFQSVKLGPESVGTLYLKADLDQLRSHFGGYLVVVLLVLLASTLVASIISARWQRRVSGPILLLADAAAGVARSKDYSVRVASPGGDELGVLTEAFNEMLSQIERRDVELRAEVKERRRAEEQLRQGQKMEAVGQLAGGVAHDFNNILGVITGYGELMRRQIDAEHPARLRLEEILKAAERAAGLTRQLLAFSRKQVFQPRVIDLGVLAADLDKMLHRVIGEDVELKVLLAPELGAVKADPTQLEQVVLNLVVNARDAMPKGGQLTIETANAEFDEAYAAAHPPAQSGRFVMLSVSDTGVGMDEETQRRIFEPFFTTKPAGQGTGLGLATVYGVVKQSGGYVWVYSEPGRGTTFKVFLPRVDEQPEILASHTATVPALGGHETVLLVEDTESLRELICEILEAQGYALLQASQGEDGLAVARAHKGPIHLLLTDLVMPKMGGADLARELASVRPQTRVLYMSGYTDGAISRQGVLQPGSTLLEKPFTPDGLARAVRDSLDAPASG